MRLLLPALVVIGLFGCTKPAAQSSKGEVLSMSEGLGGGVLAYEVTLTANALARELRSELTVTSNGNASGLDDPSTTTSVVFGFSNDVDDDEVTYSETSPEESSRSAVDLDLDLESCTDVGHRIDEDESCLVDFIFLSQAPTARSGISVNVKVRGFAAEDWTGDPEAADFAFEWFNITADVVAQGQ